MFVTNPAFTTKGEIGLVRKDIRCAVPPNLKDTVSSVLRSFQLLTALRDLQDPQNGCFIHDRIAGELGTSISELLMEAAGKTADHALKDSLQNRAQSFQSGDFVRSALIHAEQKPLSLELVIGLIPSWRFASHPRVYAGILAIPSEDQNSLVGMVDEHASKFAVQLSANSGVQVLQPSDTAPYFVVCDLLALAGDTLHHPIHMANFFPDDEGVFKRPSTKSVIYRNVYQTRYEAVTTPLVGRCCANGLIDQLPTDSHAWIHLLTWFRGHDIGHTYFDQHCRSLSGLPKYKRYILQETLADLFGLMLAISLFDTESGLCDDKSHQLTVFIAEMLRFLKRDRQIFPDASAAWFQLSSCLEAGVIRLDSKLRLSGQLEDVADYLRRLLEGLIANLRAKEAAFLEAILNKRCSFTGDVAQPFPESIQNLINRRTECTEVDPILADADSLVEKSEVSLKGKRGAVREVRMSFESRHCHRF